MTSQEPGSKRRKASELQGNLVAWKKRVVKGMSEGNGGFSPRSEEVSPWFVSEPEDEVQG